MGMQQTDFQRSIATRRARICHHKNEIFRKSTKRPAIINITARDYFIWECSRPSFGILLLSEEHEFALTASCRETGNDLARNICKPYAYTHQRVCNHKNGIFRKYTKRHTIINITARACFAWACSRPSFGVLLLSEEYKLTLMASCGETGNDLAGNRYRPCECVYQHVCNHKNGIFCRNTKRPAVITQQGVV